MIGTQHDSRTQHDFRGHFGDLEVIRSILVAFLEQLDGKKTGWGAKGAPGAPQRTHPCFEGTF